MKLSPRRSSIYYDIQMYLQHSFIQTENSSRCSLGRKQTRLYNISYRSCGPTDISIHRLVDATLYITDGCSFQNSHSNSYTGSQLNSHLDLLTPFSFSFGSLALRFSFSFGSDASPKTSFNCQNFLLCGAGSVYSSVTEDFFQEVI